MAILSLWIHESTLSFPAGHHLSKRSTVVNVIARGTDRQDRVLIRTKQPLWEVAVVAQLIDKETFVFILTIAQQSYQVRVPDIWKARDFSDVRICMAFADDVLYGHVLTVGKHAPVYLACNERLNKRSTLSLKHKNFLMYVFCSFTAFYCWFLFLFFFPLFLDKPRAAARVCRRRYQAFVHSYQCFPFRKLSKTIIFLDSSMPEDFDFLLPKDQAFVTSFAGDDGMQCVLPIPASI